MERFTISLDDALAAEFDRLMAEHGYANRSEAVRDLLRVHLDRWRESHNEMALRGQPVVHLQPPRA